MDGTAIVDVVLATKVYSPMSDERTPQGSPRRWLVTATRRMRQQSAPRHADHINRELVGRKICL